MEYPNKFVSNLLTAQQAIDAMEVLEPALRQLLGDVPLIASYSIGCTLHPDLIGVPMRVGTAGVQKFIRDSVRQQIFVPGEADVYFKLPDGRLVILFCHEGHIHVDGSDTQLAERFVTATPFKELFTAQRA